MSTTQRLSSSSIGQLFLAAIILLIMITPLSLTVATPAQANSGACAGLDWDPGPPGGNPVPTVGGTVTDSSGAGAAGTNISLIRCQGTETIVFDKTKTDSNGDYSFQNLPTTYAYAVLIEDITSYPQYLGSSALDIDFTQSNP